jgi:hypothetical protein
MKTKTKWIEDGAVTVPKLGAFDSGSTSEKATPVSADRLLINDSADSNNPKWVQAGNLPGGGGDPTSDIATATGDTTTTSASDVLVNSMTITPASGNYLVWFTGSVDHSQNAASIDLSIYAGGTKDADSERSFTRGAAQANVTTPFTCVGKVTVNGSQAIEGRWRTSEATATMHERNIAILKVA